MSNLYSSFESFLPIVVVSQSRLKIHCGGSYRKITSPYHIDKSPATISDQPCCYKRKRKHDDYFTKMDSKCTMTAAVMARTEGKKKEDGE
mmetsp:Transcript_18647/g.31843  ORF Transcript_18647/g.31843 Transcript_18647/m.31843 type:complete len:90 (-) Transcript_18647:175-444(-)